MDVDSDGARQILSSLIDSGFKNSLFLGLLCILLTISFLILFVVPALEIMVVVDMSQQVMLICLICFQAWMIRL